MQYDVAFRVMLLGSQLKQIIIFDREVKRDERDQTSIYFDDFLKLGEAHPHQAEVDKRTSESGNGDLANILLYQWNNRRQQGGDVASFLL